MSYYTCCNACDEKGGQKERKDMSIHPIISVLSDITFVVAIPYLDICALFIVKAIQIFHLRLSTTSKEPAAVGLRTVTHTTDHYRTME